MPTPLNQRELHDWHQLLNGCNYEATTRGALHDLLDAVDQFAAREITEETARRWDHTGVKLDRARLRAVLPAGLSETLAKLRELGYFGINLDEAHGGMGLPAMAEVLVVERLARRCPSLALFLAVHYTCATMLRTFGSEAQKNRLLPFMSGSQEKFILGGLAYTEPGAGSSLGEAQATATPVSTDPESAVRIHGRKIFITNGGAADLYILLARETAPTTAATATPAAPLAGLSTWLCQPYDDTGAPRPGFQIPKLEEKIRLHASPTAELLFDGLALPGGSRLGQAGKGLSHALTGLNSGRLGIAAQALGIAAAAFGDAHEYITTRKQFGQTVASFQSVRFQMAELYGRIAAGRSLLLQAVQCKERGESFRAMASIAKLHCSELAAAITPICLQFCGGMGFMDEMPLGRHLGNAQVTTIYEGTSNMQKLTLAKDLFED